MSTSDDAHRGGRAGRNPRVDERGYGNAPADRQWSQNHPRDPRDPRDSQPPLDRYEQGGAPRQPGFSGHPGHGRYSDHGHQQPPPAPQQGYSRHDYQQQAPMDERGRREPAAPAWDSAPPRRHDAGFEPQGGSGYGHHEAQNPSQSYLAQNQIYQQEPASYQDYGSRDNLYGDAPQAQQPSPPAVGSAYGAEALYDDYEQAAGVANAGNDDLYGRAPASRGREGQMPQFHDPAPVNYQPPQPSQDYDRTLGARIARDAGPSRFYLPDEQQGAHGFAQQQPAHEQLYNSGHFEHQSEAAPAVSGVQGYADQSYTDPSYPDPSYNRPLDEEPSWADDHPDDRDSGYRGGLPVEHRGAGDELDADFFSDEEDFDQEEMLPPRKSRKKLIAAVLVGAVAFGGGSAYVYKSVLGGGPALGPDGAPLVRADNSPAKETPSDPGGRQFGGGEKAIYDRLTPDGPASSRSGETQTASLATNTASDETPASAGGNSGGGNTLEDRIEEALRRAQRADGAAGAPAPVRAGPDQPIVVRSETYRPDGTPIETASPRSNPRTMMDTSDLPPPFGPGPGGRAPAASAAAPGLPGGNTRPTIETIRTAPQPQPSRPTASTETASLAASRAQAVREAAPPARPAAPVRTAALGGGHFVQMKASNDEKRALAEVSDLNEKFSVVLGGVQVSSKAVDLGEKGVWFRLLAGPLPSKDAATELCNKLKGAGLSGCLVRSE